MSSSKKGGMGGVRFPEGFLFGAATSAYQVEGSPLADGAGESIWHRFAHTPGRMLGEGAAADVACDHYRRYRDDVAIMRDLGLQAYRLSIAWSRILPAGRGAVNQAGLDFYARLVDLLLERAIQPMVTLYHWDLPAALDDQGGWLDPEITHWFGEYARIVFRCLGDRVPVWATINEPWVIADAGYLHGVHAPGHRSASEAPLVAHNLLRAHATAVQVYRSEARHKIGLVVNLEPKYPATDSALDVAATARADAYMNRQYLDPIFRRRYPEEMSDIFAATWPRFAESDFDLIQEPIDFLGVNYYTRGVTGHDEGALPVRARTVIQPQSTYTEMGWEVYPKALTEVLLWLRERYGTMQIYITENGGAFADPPTARGARVDDPRRVAFLRAHIAAAHDALAAGVDLRGYFVWSLLDNIEWTAGTTKRFGIVHVDFATQKRTLKSSGHFYRDVIRTRGGALAE